MSYPVTASAAIQPVFGQFPSLSDDKATELSRAFRLGFDNYGNSHSDLALSRAVTSLRDTFPKLSLWERIKDFFGLSDTADTQRDAAILYAYSELTMLRPNNGDNDALSEALARLMQQTYGLETRDIRMDALATEAVVRLLDRHPLLASFITLKDAALTTDPSGVICLRGELFFKDGIVPDFLSGVRLPLLAQTDSPRASETTWLNFLTCQARNADGETLVTLFRNLELDTQMQLWRQAMMQGFPVAALFAQDGLLNGELIAPQDTHVWKVSSWETLCKVYSALTQPEHAKPPCAIVMDDCTFEHQISKGEEFNEIVKDLPRGGLSHTDITVNGVLLPSAMLERMENSVRAVINDQHNAMANAVAKISEIWTDELQDALKYDKVTATKVAAIISYAAFQGGGGERLFRFAC
ncbi:hypothetical protein [unidentified bacterial endosymbiont]|uniref:hypothetical protein n=1 Tax=unidentified bacterial endosymbiont TaxID=2355 RepID=UPI00209D3A68|nr:hypothetical protein [unidentified bacterial endosymbiont]